MRWMVPLGLGVVLLASACTVRRTVSDDDDGGSPTVDDDDGAGTSGGFTTSGGATTSGGGQSYTVAEACAGIANRASVCFEDELDEVACRDAGACFRLITRDEAEPLLLSCYAAWSDDPACTKPHCLDTVFIGRELAHHNHADRCADFASRCDMDGGDICRNETSHLESDLLDALAPCFDGPCGAIDSCVADAVSTFTGGCDPGPL